MNNNACTDFLMPRSSYITGAGTVFNLAGSYYVYNTSNTPEEADAKALASDWQVIGNDLRNALKAAAGSDELQLDFRF